MNRKMGSVLSVVLVCLALTQAVRAGDYERLQQAESDSSWGEGIARAFAPLIFGAAGVALCGTTVGANMYYSTKGERSDLGWRIFGYIASTYGIVAGIILLSADTGNDI